jgi:dihydropteroate synthase
MKLKTKKNEIVFPRRALTMGILNINDDSFCADGSLELKDLLDTAEQMLIDGVDILDIGAESARTNREPIPVDEELRRLRLFLEHYPEWIRQRDHLRHDDQQVWPPLISVNTWRLEVIQQLDLSKVDIINDMSAMIDQARAKLCAQANVVLLIMHSKGLPKQKHTHVGYADIMMELEGFFVEKIAWAEQAGLGKDQIILDPGIDFAKQKEDNLKIYAETHQLLQHGCVVMLPVSRKTVIGDVLQLNNPLDRDAGTYACIVQGLLQGAQIFRVHQVKEAVQVIKTVSALMPEVS